MMTDADAPSIIPDEILSTFFRQATDMLDSLVELESPALSLDEIRHLLLTEQTKCLQSVLDHYNRNRVTNEKESPETPSGTIEQVQSALRQKCNSSASLSMNEAARIAFCRLVLYSECLWQNETVKSRVLKTSGTLSDEDVATFCGLCQAVVKVSSVVNHLCSGNSIYTNIHNSGDRKTIFPQKRLEYLQRMFLKALGYDPDYGTRQIKARFFHDGAADARIPKYNLHNAKTSPSILASTVRETMDLMEAVLSQVTAASTHDTFFADDGVTKVIAVEYSEKIIDGQTGQEITTMKHPNEAPPLVEIMQDEERDPSRTNASCTEEAPPSHHLQRAQELLQQEILGELLGLRDEERDAKLYKARERTEQVLLKILEYPPGGPERAMVLTSIDRETQRAMAMVKLWDTMLAAHDGQVPQLRSLSEHNS